MVCFDSLLFRGCFPLLSPFANSPPKDTRPLFHPLSLHGSHTPILSHLLLHSTSSNNSSSSITATVHSPSGYATHINAYPLSLASSSSMPADWSTSPETWMGGGGSGSKVSVLFLFPFWFQHLAALLFFTTNQPRGAAHADAHLAVVGQVETGVEAGLCGEGKGKG